MEEVQDIKTHVRWQPIYHFVLAPIMLINFIYAIVRVVQDPGWDRFEYIFLSIGLVIMTLLVRINPLKAQDRLIRLEEQLRIGRILENSNPGNTAKLKESHFIALRFAPDDEVEGLVDRILTGELKTQKDIKTAIKNWRGDFFRV